jgi:hypothetical protein
MKLTFMQEKYILRARSAPMGFVVPEGKQQTQLCEKLVELGKFVRIKHEVPAFALPDFAEELGMEVEE